ncbi:MAG: hypothetical protein AAGA03_15385 [Planctomycetota bacterium]
MTDQASTQRRRAWLFAGLMVVIGIYAVLSVFDARAAARRLSDATVDLDEMEQKLASIQRLQQKPSIAALDLESPAEVSQRVLRARESAKLPEAAILQLIPSSPVRVDRSDFKMRSTSIQVRATTLERVLQFCDALRDDQTGLMVRDLVLTQPRSARGGGADVWECELVLTQMIYSPKSQTES